MLKLFMSLVTFLYRVSGGRIGGKMQGASVLLLTTTGRKTGKQRTRPLIYLMDGPAYVLTASAGGTRYPGWFVNLRTNPHAVIQVRDKQVNVVAEVADKEKKRELWARLIAMVPSYAKYQQKTTREFPMVLLHPVDESAPEEAHAQAQMDRVEEIME